MFSLQGCSNVALILTPNRITVGVKRAPQSRLPLPDEIVSFLFDGCRQVITVRSICVLYSRALILRYTMLGDLIRYMVGNLATKCYTYT